MNWDLLFKRVNPKTLLDIGAHTGTFSWNVSQKFPDCSCYLVEANPACESHLKLLGYPYEICALSSQAGEAPFYIEKINPTATGASLYKENTNFYAEGKYNQIRVSTKKLDSINPFPDREIDLLKIDTQGSELDILAGGQSVLSRTNYILIETSLVQYNLGSPLLNVVIDKLKDYGFSIQEILDYKFADNSIFQLDFLLRKDI
jgi:FkbM family methyltransferase